MPAAVTIPSLAVARDSLTRAAASLVPNAAKPTLNAATPTLGNTENTESPPVSSSRATAPRGPASSMSPPASWARSRAPTRTLSEPQSMKARFARSTITHGPQDTTVASRDDNSALSLISSSPRKASTAQPP